MVRFDCGLLGFACGFICLIGLVVYLRFWCAFVGWGFAVVVVLFCVLLLFNLLLFGDVCVVNSVACSLVPFVWVAVFVC